MLTFYNINDQKNINDQIDKNKKIKKENLCDYTINDEIEKIKR